MSDTAEDGPVRWRLERAGIINVYQYGNEVLDFAGGRLLLRGVNGSGKSTAMNMLLPFLLTASQRNIDAAGDQRGLLHSWMLGGRDDAQPVGYLWIEFRRGGEQFACGCGIRANRQSDRVTTWWFATSKRPGIDFDLVEDRVPLSADALRERLGDDPVFREPDRPAYRRLVEQRLFGGVSLDGHLRLIDKVRNPRVGDRIDVDLPQDLMDALPRLSDKALADAAAPLDDLEEHRRNVAALQRTVAALDGLLDRYRAYCASDLHTRVCDARALLERVRRWRRDEARLRMQAAQADQHAQRIAGRISDEERCAERSRSEIAAIVESGAYRDGQQLDGVRDLVERLCRDVADAEERVASVAKRIRRTSDTLTSAQRRSEDDLERVSTSLSEAMRLVVQCGIAARPPLAPQLRHAPLDLGHAPLEETEGSAPEPMDAADPLRRLSLTAAAVQQRRRDIAAVDAAQRVLDEAHDRLRRAEADRDSAVAAWEHAAEQCARLEQRLMQASADWHRSVWQWAADAGPTCQAAGAPKPTPDDASPSTATDGTPALGVPMPPRDATSPQLTPEQRAALRAGLLDAVDAATTRQHDTVAAAEHRLNEARASAEEQKATLDELMRRAAPSPPRLGWQTPAEFCLADVVDFADALQPDERAGLEAALEASGLLGARPVGPGAFELTTGELVAVGGQRVARPLSAWLEVTIPAHLAASASASAGMVADLLEAVCCEPVGSARHETGPVGDADPAWSADDRRRVEALGASVSVCSDGHGIESDGRNDSAVAVDTGPPEQPLAAIEAAGFIAGAEADASVAAAAAVSTDGTFRVGVLRGRHAKERAEYIGAAARREALERAREAARLELQQRLSEAARLDRLLGERRQVLDRLHRHRETFPPTSALERSEWEATAAADEQHRANERRQAAEAARSDADRAAIDAGDDLHRVAAQHSLPRDRHARSAIGESLSELDRHVTDSEARLKTLERQVSEWARVAEQLRDELVERAAADEYLTSSLAERDRQQSRLDTLIASVGAEYRQLLAERERLEAALRETDAALPALRVEHEAAIEERAGKRAEADAAARNTTGAEDDCDARRGELAEVLATPGYLTALLDSSAAQTPSATAGGSEGLGSLIVGIEQLLARRASADRQPSAADAEAGSAEPDATDPAPDAAEAVPDATDPAPDATDPAPDAADIRADAGARLRQPPPQISAENVRQSLRQRRDALGGGWDAHDLQPDLTKPLRIEVSGPHAASATLFDAHEAAASQLRTTAGLLDRKQHEALHELLQGLIATEIAGKMHDAHQMIRRMNQRLGKIATAHNVGVRLRWRRSPELDPSAARMVDLLAKPPDLRSPEESDEVREALSSRLAEARLDEPEAPYRQLIARTLDYKSWHELAVMVRRPERPETRLGRRTPLSEGEKKLVTYLPLFVAVAASYDAIAAAAAPSRSAAPGIARFVLLDDAFAKVSADNHDALFGLLVALDLDFVATSERLWGDHASVPELSIVEIVRDPSLRTIVLDRYSWQGHTVKRVVAAEQVVAAERIAAA